MIMKKFITILTLALAFTAVCAQDIVPDSVADPYAKFKGKSDIEVFNEGVRYQRKRDYAHALECFQYAADQGNVQGQYWTGDIYFHGSAGKNDNDQAIKYWTMASDQNHGQAQFYLALLYHGIGDYTNAIKYWELAADNGHPEAISNIGYCYEQGLGVDCDETMALNWYTRGAEDGDPTATYNVGLYYELGKGGLTADTAKAIEWYAQAWSMGYYKAKEALDRLQPQQ